MSEEQVTANETDVTETDSADHADSDKAELTAEQRLAKQFEKRKVVILPSGANRSAFDALLSTFDEGELLDWTEGLDYDAPSFILAQAESGETRVAAFPKLEVAMADAVVRSKAYEWYLAKAALALKKDDAAKGLFATPAGFFLGFDRAAYDFQAAEWVDFLVKKKGAKKLNPGGLRKILSSEPFAKSKYASVPQEFWQNMLKHMVAKAEKNGYSAAILQHWLATREVTAADLPEFTWNEDELSAVETAAQAPAEAPAEAAPATA